MKSRFHEAADAELTEAVFYYDDKASGLGDRLLAEVRAATRRIEQYPEIAPVIEYGVRVKLLMSFPYSLMYVTDPDETIHRGRRTSEQAAWVLGRPIADAAARSQPVNCRAVGVYRNVEEPFGGTGHRVSRE
jgi:hypothetical protein